MRELLAITIGYLLGSVLPADLLARARGIDIRRVGTGNPGTTNALRELGSVPGAVTLVYDAGVGLVALAVSAALGLSPGWGYLAGTAAIVGHLFPVFFGFRGGQGMAAAAALLIWEMGVALSRGWLTVGGLALLAALGAAVFALTRSATMVGVVAPPLLAVQILLAGPDWRFGTFVTGLAVFIWLTQIGIARTNHLFRSARAARLTAGRPGAPLH